ncbi:hypothetical protein TWF102_006529 [Orbilia oligospora]|uniref:Uncharacterized protein n=1 Tax=Orbilia oligospora TaxID=2813651 RepID=A0A7C8JJQ2_ORBOL|nr:hypothetical protein TWF102_006529 [Orbilia oligospora]
MPTAKQTIESSPQYLTLTSFTNFQSTELTALSSLTSSITPTTPPYTISTYLETLWNSFLLLYNDTEFTWSQLPDLNIYIRDWYNFSPPFSQSSTPLPGLVFSKDEWINLNAFLATLTRTSLSAEIPKSPTDYSLYAIWSLRCLEVSPETLHTLDPADIQTAAVWIVTAKTEIYKLCKEGKEYEGNLARGGEGFSEKGWKGFSLERWAVWEDAFKRLLELENEKEDVEIGVIRLVRQATVVMRMVGASNP